MNPTPTQLLEMPVHTPMRAYESGRTVYRTFRGVCDDEWSVGFSYSLEPNSEWDYFSADELEFIEEPPVASSVHFTTEPVALTGGSVDYYKFMVEDPTTADAPYFIEVNDLIEAAGMNFAEGNIVKAIARIAGIRNGKGKPGVTGVYDAEKVVFFGDRVLKQQLRLAAN